MLVQILYILLFLNFLIVTDFDAVLTALVDTDLSHCFNSLSNSTIGRLTENYIHDFVHIVFPKLQSQNDSYYEVVITVFFL